MHQKLKHALLILFIALLASIVFYIIQLIYTSNINTRSSRIYEQSLVAAINQYEYLPSLISEDEILRLVLINPKTDHLAYSQKLQFISDLAGADAIYLMDINGKVKATSNYNSENNGFLNRNYSFRPYFKKAISERKKQFYYAQGATTGIPGFFIASPIINNGDPIGVAVVKLDMRHWERKWSESEENIIVTDKNNVIILSAIQKWRYKTIGELSENTLDNIRDQQQFDEKHLTSLFSKSISLNFDKDINNNDQKAYWLINKKMYLVNSFDISETGWKLYYLVKHNSILNSAIIFFFVSAILSMLAHLNLMGRKRIIESNKKNQILEAKRREELQTVMDNIHIGVILFSESGLLLSLNQYAQHLLINNTSHKGEINYIHQLIKMDDKNIDDILLEDISTPAYHETYTITNDIPGTPVMFAASKVNTMDNEVYLMTIVNISRRKIAEDELISINEHLEDIIKSRTQELQEAQLKLNQKNKATALGNMAATIVHELSQPLTAMKSSIAAINAKIQHSNWNGVVESASRLAPLNEKMNNVIKLLKFFSYQDSNSYEVLNLKNTLEQILYNLKDTFQAKNIHIDFKSDDNNVDINANPVKIDIVFSNIIQNAIDALEKTDKPIIEILLTQNNTFAEISIKDNAGGVDENIMNNMFSPYFTTKEVGKGLGLGLAITYEIIQEYNGTITANNHNQGAIFVIRIPLADSENKTNDKGNITQ